MLMRYFLVYVVVEMAAFIALAATIGVGWTLLALMGTFVVGLALAGSQLRRQLATLRRGSTNPGAQVTDSALVALGTVLVFVPGLVTTAAGLLMLLPPTRLAMRPLAAGLAARGVAKHVTFISGRRDYIDGEVIDVHDAPGTWTPPRPAIRPQPE